MAEEYELPQKVIEQLKEELKELRTTGRNEVAEKIKVRSGKAGGADRRDRIHAFSRDRAG